jgi:hypothetical protein
MKYTNGMVSGGMICVHTKFRDNWLRHSGNIKLIT